MESTLKNLYKGGATAWVGNCVVNVKGHVENELYSCTIPVPHNKELPESLASEYENSVGHMCEQYGVGEEDVSIEYLSLTRTGETPLMPVFMPAEAMEEGADKEEARIEALVAALFGG